MQHAKSLKIASSRVLSCIAFLLVLHSVSAYARNFNEAYAVPFREVVVVDIRRDLGSTNFIPTSSASTYDRYIHVARLCFGCEDFQHFVENLNNMDPLTGNNATTSIGLLHLSDSKFCHLVRSNSTSAWMYLVCLNLNAKVAPQKQGRLSAASFV